MARTPRTPADLARRFGERSAERAIGRGESVPAASADAFARQTYRLPRDQARDTARDWFARYPKAAYMTRVESWRVLDDGLIEFTMRRLPTAD
ncbi:hypothetical protein [Salinarimonas ramus]|uniref:Uncharacterized protein n=1 Tax=Salinarimonas ramus TaxID=690164 RepID=A0A917QDD9_9HYPH|nr:hypothetical protein [Salinarimonas ramus]GGK44934.1 hypothetical protein GCM10011322_35130 [Salinarimonas ramus]